MSTNALFRFPIPAPSPAEARALSYAAAYLHRAANELATRKLGSGYGRGTSSPMDDLPSALAAAGCLHTSLLEMSQIFCPPESTIDLIEETE